MTRLWNSLGLWSRWIVIVVLTLNLVAAFWLYVVVPILTAVTKWAVEEVVEELTGDDDDDEDEDGDGEDENGDEPDPDGVHGNGGGQLPFDSSLASR